MDEKHDATRCKQCDHLMSFHGEDGCGTWLLGVRAVPLYRCACVVSPTKSGSKFPVIPSNKFQIPPVTLSPLSTPSIASNSVPSAPVASNEPTIANLPSAAQASATAQANLRNRLDDVAEGLRRTAAELKNLEDTLDTTLRRLAPNKTSQAPTTPLNNSSKSTTHHHNSIHSQSPSPVSAIHPPDDSSERRASNDRRRRHYAMIAERRVGDRRTVAA